MAKHVRSWSWKSLPLVMEVKVDGQTCSHVNNTGQSTWNTVDSLFRQKTKPEDHIQGAWHGDALLLDVPESSPNPPISSQNTRREMRTETNAAEAFRRLKARTPLPKQAVDRRLLSYRSCLKFLVTQKNSACVGMKSYHIRLPCEGNGLPSARLS